VEILSRRLLLIANPAARRAPRLLRRARAAFDAAKVGYEVLLTERPGHAAELAAMARGRYDAVFTLGGDGTAMEVVGALANTGVPVGILPGGTGNLVARSLGVPLRLDRAVPALLDGDVARVDLGLVNGVRRFAFTVGVGVDARMISETPPALKRRFGIAAYVVSAGKAVFQGRSFAVRVSADGEWVERRAVAVMVANFGSVLDELFTLGPGIRQDDGRLDLCVFSPGSLFDAVRLAWRLVRKDFRPHPQLLYRAGREFRIECTPEQIVQADGEVLGVTPFDVRVEPLAAVLLVPRES
jgi:diacylglycerol kinase (ATP)